MRLEYCVGYIKMAQVLSVFYEEVCVRVRSDSALS